jgi:hypothetical protein
LLVRAAPVGGLCDGKPCWLAKPTSFQYSDKFLTPDGVKKTSSRRSRRRQAQGAGQGAGIFIDPPALPLTLPVKVQVKNTQNGECWEAIYSAASRTKREIQRQERLISSRPRECRTLCADLWMGRIVSGSRRGRARVVDELQDRLRGDGVGAAERQDDARVARPRDHGGRARDAGATQVFRQHLSLAAEVGGVTSA